MNNLSFNGALLLCVYCTMIFLFAEIIHAWVTTFWWPLQNVQSGVHKARWTGVDPEPGKPQVAARPYPLSSIGSPCLTAFVPLGHPLQPTLTVLEAITWHLSDQPHPTKLGGFWDPPCEQGLTTCMATRGPLGLPLSCHRVSWAGYRTCGIPGVFCCREHPGSLQALDHNTPRK